MSHQRPIPEAAQSPYPLHPLPASAAAEGAETGKGESGKSEAADADDSGAQGDSKVVSIDPRSWGRREQIGLGAALGIGSAALLAALLYSRRDGGKAEARREAA